MNEIKPLSIEETKLKEEMKIRCLNKGLYIDEKAEEKFKMLCHLEDFEVKYHDLKHNWNELKKYIEKEKSRFGSYRYDEILNKMRQLEEGGNNEN